ncbi:CobW family GTP-binding protein [Echinimonas agarilytica]|uniref:GTP-binding protein n=1 Tax=Echinimonas agarilytica TaxID=1215918 RepID=A0AA41W736_9GAMM|nr:GTP-binding protein [Echinimonas agarilytica]MCM2680355.1 GTP-binding protein [Echinimonas agarilytica]
MSKPLQHIPTNIITGFLGVGKTTAISYLLRSKPKHERWAVLVNEFGEIGIDGSLLQGRHPHDEEVFVAEVPGGCMCCVMGMPTKVTLNKLLNQAQPDRLLIEPTGLGHPQEVLDLLASEHYQQVLDVRSTITLVDPRVISDERYTDHPIYNQQLQVADLIVANKSDCYDETAVDNLRAYVNTLGSGKVCSVVSVEQGRIELDWLDFMQVSASVLSSEVKQQHGTHKIFHHVSDQEMATAAEEPNSDEKIPAEGYIEVRNHKGDYFSRGWRFDASWVFDIEQIIKSFKTLDCERMKAVFNTEQGAKGFSLIGGELQVGPLQQSQGNRIELIDRSKHSFDHLLNQLLASVLR